MQPIETKSTQLAVEVKAADRNFQHFAKTGVIITVLFVIATLSFIAWRSIITTNQLQKVVTNQTTELAQIRENQSNNHKDNENQLAAITSLIQQSDAYNKCLVSLFTHNTYVPSSALETCKPAGSLLPSFSQQTSSTATPTSTPAKTAPSSSQSIAMQPTQPTNSNKPVTSPSPQPKPSTLLRWLHDIGL